VKTRNRTRA